MKILVFLGKNHYSIKKTKECDMRSELFQPAATLQNFEEINNEDCQYIFDAARNGEINIFNTLKAFGFNFETQSKQGNTAAHVAAFHAHINILEFLAGENVNFTVRNNKGQTPLDIARIMKSDKVIEALERIMSQQSLGLTT